MAGLVAYFDTLGLYGLFSPRAIAWPLTSDDEVQNMVAVITPVAKVQLLVFR